jgi:hypothetical protein
MTIIEINHSETAGYALKRPALKPVFRTQQDAIKYAESRACSRSGEIRIVDSREAVERVIPFSEADRKL